MVLKKIVHQEEISLTCIIRTRASISSDSHKSMRVGRCLLTWHEQRNKSRWVGVQEFERDKTGPYRNTRQGGTCTPPALACFIYAEHRGMLNVHDERSVKKRRRRRREKVWNGFYYKCEKKVKFIKSLLERTLILCRT